MRSSVSVTVLDRRDADLFICDYDMYALHIQQNKHPNNARCFAALFYRMKFSEFQYTQHGGHNL